MKVAAEYHLFRSPSIITSATYCEICEPLQSTDITLSCHKTNLQCIYSLLRNQTDKDRKSAECHIVYNLQQECFQRHQLVLFSQYCSRNKSNEECSSCFLLHVCLTGEPNRFVPLRAKSMWRQYISNTVSPCYTCDCPIEYNENGAVIS